MTPIFSAISARFAGEVREASSSTNAFLRAQAFEFRRRSRSYSLCFSASVTWSATRNSSPRSIDRDSTTSTASPGGGARTLETWLLPQKLPAHPATRERVGRGLTLLGFRVLPANQFLSSGRRLAGEEWLEECASEKFWRWFQYRETKDISASPSATTPR